MKLTWAIYSLTILLFFNVASALSSELVSNDQHVTSRLLDFSKEYEGVIGGKHPIQMLLTKKGDTLSGVYFYKTYRKNIKLKGFIKDNKFTLEEFTQNGVQTGIFLGELFENHMLRGTWTSSDKKKKMEFSLNEIFSYGQNSKELKANIDKWRAEETRKDGEIRKIKPEIFVKIPGENNLYKIINYQLPVYRDNSETYYIYKNEFGSVLLIEEYRKEGEKSEHDYYYYFDSDEVVAATTRRYAGFELKTNEERNVYLEYTTLYYDSLAKAISKETEYYFNGKKANTLNYNFPSFDKLLYADFQSLWQEKFRDSKEFKKDKEWICYISVFGYGHSSKLMNVAKPLEFFKENIIPIDSSRDIDPIFKENKFKGALKFVGKINSRKVYNVFYQVLDGKTNEWRLALKVLLVEREKGLFSPVLYLDMEEIDKPSSIVRVKGTDILTDISRISGTGNYYDEWYFSFDSGRPRALDFQASISKALHEILPKGYGVWKGGGFDLSNLRYSHSVWREGDGNCCPSGGQIEIIFHLKNGELKVKSYHWDKADKSN